MKHLQKLAVKNLQKYGQIRGGAVSPIFAKLEEGQYSLKDFAKFLAEEKFTSREIEQKDILEVENENLKNVMAFRRALSKQNGGHPTYKVVLAYTPTISTTETAVHRGKFINVVVVEKRIVTTTAE